MASQPFSSLSNFCIGMGQGEQVEQLPSILRVKEGTNTLISFTYVNSASLYFPWYKQDLKNILSSSTTFVQIWKKAEPKIYSFTE